MYVGRTNNTRFYIFPLLHVSTSFPVLFNTAINFSSCHRKTKVSTEDQGDTLVLTAASRASTLQYQVPLASVTDLSVLVCHLDAYFIVEKEELLLTCTRY